MEETWSDLVGPKTVPQPSQNLFNFPFLFPELEAHLEDSKVSEFNKKFFTSDDNPNLSCCSAVSLTCFILPPPSFSFKE